MVFLIKFNEKYPTRRLGDNEEMGMEGLCLLGNGHGDW
jgi:hypothetical protein